MVRNSGGMTKERHIQLWRRGQAIERQGGPQYEVLSTCMYLVDPKGIERSKAICS